MSVAKWERVSLGLPEGLAFEEWSQIGDTLARFERGVMWWVGDWWRYGEQRYGERSAQAIESGRWAFGTWANAGYVAGRVETSRRREVLSWSHHYEVAALPPDEQDRFLDLAEAEGLGHKDLRTLVRRARVRFEERVILPAGKYSVILADPPWRYDFIEADNRAIENQYPTLTAEEVASFTDAEGRSIGDLAADESVLFLWATNPKLAEAMAVIDAWGFRYITNLVWVKDRIGMGYWARARHELLLVAKRGEMPPPAEADRPDSVIEAPRGAHSAKPASVYQLIESIWPDAPKIEVFSRIPREGWAAFGNQL